MILQATDKAGNTTRQTWRVDNGPAGTQDLSNDYTRHCGNSSGLSLAVYRLHGPKRSRWLSSDPIQEHAGHNSPQYADNSSVSSSDDLGLMTQMS